MASIYERPNSPFHWLKFRDPNTGKMARKSTGYRVGDPGARNKAMIMANEASNAELKMKGVKAGEHWGAWVPGYIATRYITNEATKRRVKSDWTTCEIFLREFGVLAPRHLDYATAALFIPWRTSDRCTRSKVKHNSALNEFRFLKMICREAVRRGFASVNGCAEVELRRRAPKVKPEISTEDQAKIEASLENRPGWMRDHWIFLMCQGCRAAEARVPLDRVNEARNEITLRLKGGKLHTAPMHESVLALYHKAKKEGAEVMVDVPLMSFSGTWKLAFKAVGLDISVHSTRVTVITRLLRAGKTPAEVCAFIGQTESVNAIYRRLKPQDVRSLTSILGVGSSLLLQGNA